jgi:quercetin dioxygenase-like cupin family protein
MFVAWAKPRQSATFNAIETTMNVIVMNLKLALLALAASTVLAAPAALADGHAKGTFIDSSDIVFEDIIPGVVSFATVSGDRATGSHGTFVRIPAGAATPSHTHGASYEAVIIQGKFENPTEGNDASNVTLSAGSYYSVPADAEHVTRCAIDSPVDCISFFWQNVPFDFAVAE